MSGRGSKTYEAKLERIRGGARRDRLWNIFRLRTEEYDRILEFQRAHPVFRLLLNKPHYKLREAVEHRHRDGMLRGLMSGMLNKAYGLVEKLYPDNTAEVLRALADFHEQHPATQVLGEPRYGVIGSARCKGRKGMKYGPIGDITKNVRLQEK